jgi:hypothetical protein
MKSGDASQIILMLLLTDILIMFRHGIGIYYINVYRFFYVATL